MLGAQLRLSATAYPTEAGRAALITRVLERVRAVPGVENAGATLNRFVPGFFMVTAVHIEAQPTTRRPGPHRCSSAAAAPAISTRCGFRCSSGRDFPPATVSTSRGSRSSVGCSPTSIGPATIRSAAASAAAPILRWLTVVGVVGDVSDVGFSQPPAPTVYVSFNQNNVAITPVSLVVRTNGDPLALVPAVRAAVFAADPAQPIDSVTTLEQFLGDSLGPQRFRSTLLLVLGGIGLTLAGLGVYGVTARSVEERSRELGVRQALGASPAGLLRLVVGQALRVVSIGLAAGGALAAGAASVLLNTLPNLEQAEGWWAVPAVALLFAVATLAATVPARRALTMSPTEAFRAD